MFFSEVNKDKENLCTDIKCLLELGTKRESDLILRVTYNKSLNQLLKIEHYFFFAQMIDVKNGRVLKSGGADSYPNDEASLKAAIHSVIEQVRIDK